MKKAELVVERRTEKGKNVARRIRAAGNIPAVLYGKGSEPIPMTVGYKDLAAILHGEESHNTLITMKFKGEKDSEKELIGLPKEILFDPLMGTVMHIDFQQVHHGVKLQTEVPIHLMGTPHGVKTGGVLEHLLRAVDIRCFPKDIPDYIEVDVTQLEVGSSVHVSDLITQEDVEILNDPEQAVALVAAPTIEKEPVAEEEEEGLEEEGAVSEAEKEEQSE